MVYLAMIVGVWYPGYRGMPVMNQPCNPAQDTLRLPATAPGASSTGYPDGTLHQISTSRGFTCPKGATAHSYTTGQDGAWHEALFPHLTAAHRRTVQGAG
jgi:hypothetical protein